MKFFVKLRVEALFVNCAPAYSLSFDPRGILSERHSGWTRQLNGHDRLELFGKTELRKGDTVFNTRSWTATSLEDLQEIESEIGSHLVRPGDLLENITFSGVESFSKLPSGSLITFPRRVTQLALAIWRENTPCATLRDSFAERHGSKDLGKKMLEFAVNRRGVMGFVFSSGTVELGDEAKLYLP